MKTPTLERTPGAAQLRFGSARTNAPPARSSACEITTTEHVLDPQTLGDHLDRLFRAAWAMCGSRQLAEELVQETYVRVLSRPRLLRRDDDLGYLIKALRNIWYTHLRNERARRQAITPALQPPEDLAARNSRDDPQASVEATEVFEAIAALPAEFRDVIVSVDVAGLSYGEAAKALRLRTGTVTSRLFRARSKVAKSLSESYGRQAAASCQTPSLEIRRAGARLSI
jgi:RNA polymerase sigma-70 factor (ECF subfamily)